MSDIVRKLWGFRHTLRHDGVDYGDHIGQTTDLLSVEIVGDLPPPKDRATDALGPMGAALDEPERVLVMVGGWCNRWQIPLNSGINMNKEAGS